MNVTIHCCDWKDDSKKIAYVASIEKKLPDTKQLETLQKWVDGYIDIYHHEPTGRDWVINDEGLLNDLPLNPWAASQGLHLVGTIVEIHGQLD